MPRLVDQVTEQIADAIRRQDSATLAPLRMLKAALVTREVDTGRPLDDTEALQIVASLVKQRRDSIEQFTKGNRPELAEKEAREIVVLERFQPPAATPEDIAAAVNAAVAETGAASAKDFGKVMKAAMAGLAGKTADGKAVSEAVRKRLS